MTRVARAAASAASLVVAAGACRAIVGISDLTTADGGSDATADVASDAARDAAGDSPALDAADASAPCKGLGPGPSCFACCNGAYEAGRAAFLAAALGCGCEAGGSCLPQCDGTMTLCGGQSNMQNCMPCLRTNCSGFDQACPVVGSGDCTKYLTCMNCP